MHQPQRSDTPCSVGAFESVEVAAVALQQGRGRAADAPLPVTMAPEGAAIAAEIWQQCRDDIGQRQKSMRAEFEALAAGSVKTQWRNSIEYTGSGLLRDARMADLIVTAAAAWIVKAIVAIGKATRLGKAQP